MRIVLIVCMLLSLSLLGCEGRSDSTKQSLDQDQSDLASEIGKAADSAGEKIDELSVQFDKIAVVLQQKYEEISPKIEELVNTLKQKSDELSRELEKRKQEAAESTGE